MGLLVLSDTHLGHDMPARPRTERPRSGAEFFENFEAALTPARTGKWTWCCTRETSCTGAESQPGSPTPHWLRSALSQMRGYPVLLLPGNHERGELPHPLLALHRNLQVFDRLRTVVLEAGDVRVAFAGFPYERDMRDRFGELHAAATAGAPAVDVKLLCLHHCVEGATCGPGDFTFRDGPDVIRRSALPSGFEAVLCGHVHRHQVLRAPGLPPVIYSGSTEKTSSSEAGETKGIVLLWPSEAGLERYEFRPLPDHLSMGHAPATARAASVSASIADGPTPPACS